MKDAPRVLVVGIGNVLLHDDAVGPHVIAWLEAHYDFASGTETCDAGTPGLDLMTRVGGADAVVAIDAVRLEAAPGTIRLWGRDELLRSDPGIRMSPHDPALGQVLGTLTFAGCVPRHVVLVGVVPKKVAPGIGLSPEVRGAITPVGELVIEKLRELGGGASRRREPRRADTWWEQHA